MNPKPTIGIPRSLGFDEWRPLFDRILAEHRLEVVHSPVSSKATVGAGLKKCIDEVCLPLKVFYGHLEALAARNVDYFFIPRLVSVAPGRNYCPKFHVLPDLAQAAWPQAKIISPFIDWHHDKKRPLEIHLRRAILTALEEHGLASRGSKKIIDRALKADVHRPATPTDDGDAKDTLKIAVLGHHYGEGDRFLNMNLGKRLREMGATALFGPAWADDLAAGALEEGMYYETVVRTARALEQKILSEIDGIILITFFACGPDSYGAETLLYRLDNLALDIPVMRLIFDEHTAEEGLVTRLETFIEMAKGRKAARERTLC